MQGNLIAICLEQLDDSHDLLRQWLALCLGKIWNMFDAARWCGVRDSAHEKLYKFLTDTNPEVGYDISRYRQHYLTYQFNVPKILLSGDYLINISNVRVNHELPGSGSRCLCVGQFHQQQY